MRATGNGPRLPRAGSGGGGCPGRSTQPGGAAIVSLPNVAHWSTYAALVRGSWPRNPEGIHDATLVERLWGHDLRVEGIVVEPIGGLDNLQGLEMLLDRLRKTASNGEFLMAITKTIPTQD